MKKRKKESDRRHGSGGEHVKVIIEANNLKKNE
jgi:hypothetical protein